ncbi:MAG: hypothetical protein EHM89_03000 [Acidobacteria bacterium]|nr:MAG: hypothetical protein EHM89_03000 [Acidobacteriota bacterium]
MSDPSPRNPRSTRRYLWTIASILLVAATAMITPFPFASESATMFLLGGALIGAGNGMRRLRSERISENEAGAAE